MKLNIIALIVSASMCSDAIASGKSPWSINTGNEPSAIYSGYASTNANNSATGSPWSVNSGNEPSAIYSGAGTNPTPTPTKANPWNANTENVPNAIYAGYSTSNSGAGTSSTQTGTSNIDILGTVKDENLSLYQKSKIINKHLEQNGQTVIVNGIDQTQNLKNYANTMSPKDGKADLKAFNNNQTLNQGLINAFGGDVKKAQQYVEDTKKAREAALAKVQDQIEFNTMKMSAEEEFAGKALFCLIGGGFSLSECKAPLKHYFKLLYKKPHDAVKFLQKSPMLSGLGSKHKSKVMNQFSQDMKEMLKGTGNDNVGSSYQPINESTERMYQDMIAKLDSNYKWNGKYYNGAVGGFGAYNYDGEVQTVTHYACDVDPSTPGNLNSRYQVERYVVDYDPIRYAYKAKVLTHLPENCALMRNYFPYTQPVLKYDTKKCNPNQEYRWEDFSRGYYVVTNSHGTTTRVQIPKDCWYEDEAASEKIRETLVKNQMDLMEKALQDKWDGDYTNLRLHNLTVDIMFKDENGRDTVANAEQERARYRVPVSSTPVKIPGAE